MTHVVPESPITTKQVGHPDPRDGSGDNSAKLRPP